MDTKTNKKPLSKVIYLLSKLEENYKTDFKDWNSVQQSLSYCLRDVEQSKKGTYSDGYKKAVKALIGLDCSFYKDLEKAKAVLSKAFSSLDKGSEKKQLQLLNRALNTLAINHESDHKHWTQTIKVAQRSFDIGEQIEFVYTPGIKFNKFKLPVYKKNKSELTKALNLKPSLLDDVKKVSAEVSLLIDSLSIK